MQSHRVQHASVLPLLGTLFRICRLQSTASVAEYSWQRLCRHVALSRPVVRPSGRAAAPLKSVQIAANLHEPVSTSLSHTLPPTGPPPTSSCHRNMNCTACDARCQRRAKMQDHERDYHSEIGEALWCGVTGCSARSLNRVKIRAHVRHKY